MISSDLKEKLTEICLYANTAGYIFRRMRALPELMKLAKETNSQSIADQAISHLGPNVSSEKLVDVYGLIVSLSHKDDTTARDALKRFADEESDWIADVSQYALSARVPENCFDTTLAQATQSLQVARTSVSASSAKIVINPSRK